MKSLMMYSPNPTDATSFYRATGPLQELKRKMGFSLQMSRDTNWAVIKGVDVVFMQRPFTDNHLKIVEMYKSGGVPVWVDYDDDLYSVPRNNRTHRMYNDINNQNNISRILAMADVVTVSTQCLKRKLSSVLAEISKIHEEKKVATSYDLTGAKIKVVENAYDWKFVKRYAKKGLPKETPQKLIMWRGSDTHDKDMYVYMNQMRTVYEQNLDWKWMFVGSPFWLALETLRSAHGHNPQNVMEVEGIDPMEYWEFIRGQSPALMIVPLEENEFNLSKSNIAWIEATHAGAVCLAPEWEEWKRPGVITYKDKADFQIKLHKFVSGEIPWEENYLLSKEYIDENLMLDQVNYKRQLILELLFDEQG